ncbi:hypothetical protein EVAR_101363_1 [Eumeta japonica]|uniref:Uncharacterized protein n=1 Tax=Eumeta variegata TaxID=151549 RepID=A0A4C1SLM3_EUMVA|nr:hypothetical protein EVAR_101363_1 [Eumeta japonica]
MASQSKTTRSYKTCCRRAGSRLLSSPYCAVDPRADGDAYLYAKGDEDRTAGPAESSPPGAPKPEAGEFLSRRGRAAQQAPGAHRGLTHSDPARHLLH